MYVDRIRRLVWGFLYIGMAVAVLHGLAGGQDLGSQFSDSYGRLLDPSS